MDIFNRLIESILCEDKEKHLEIVLSKSIQYDAQEIFQKAIIYNAWRCMEYIYTNYYIEMEKIVLDGKTCRVHKINNVLKWLMEKNLYNQIEIENYNEIADSVCTYYSDDSHYIKYFFKYSLEMNLDFHLSEKVIGVLIINLPFDLFEMIISKFI